MSTSNPVSYHHGDVRQALLEGGLEELREKGVEAFSLRALARRIGVSPMAPYRHYPDKNALLAAIAVHGFDALTEKLRAADMAAPAEKALLAQGCVYVTFALENQALFRLMFGASKTEDHSVGEAFYVLQERIQAQFGAAANTSLIYGCWSLVHGLAVLMLDQKVSQVVSVEPVLKEIFGRLSVK